MRHARSGRSVYKKVGNNDLGRSSKYCSRILKSRILSVSSEVNFLLSFEVVHHLQDPFDKQEIHRFLIVLK